MSAKDDKELYKDYEKQLPLRIASGSFSDNRILTTLLYLLMRDEVVPGAMEGLFIQLESKGSREETQFTNGWLAAYASYLADRLEVLQ